MGDTHVGLQARLSQALRNTCHFQIQLRGYFYQPATGKIGVMYGNPKPPPEDEPSSSTPRFRLDIRR